GEQSVHHVVGEGSLVAERPDVELQRFELDAESVRHVLEMQGREVGLTCLRTETRELGNAPPNRVVAIRLRIRERLEYFFRRSLLAFGRHGSAPKFPREDFFVERVLEALFYFTLPAVVAAMRSGASDSYHTEITRFAPE